MTFYLSEPTSDIFSHLSFFELYSKNILENYHVRHFHSSIRTLRVTLLDSTIFTMKPPADFLTAMRKLSERELRSNNGSRVLSTPPGQRGDLHSIGDT
ncbi:hypothetical protein Y032_0322g2464 [Ancylostoma ceylanicum]|uniref:Uncharacterized protein n=1 Tax=Ancylostoma ceylanicum TaxID=53326 RepID=A0A016S0M4_9BILA|nr:hypothetical protein Y032_0322g2464 [Ancylostoma ceylanicum]